MQTLYSFCGLPGTGKTTLSQFLFEILSKQSNVKLYSYDEYKKNKKIKQQKEKETIHQKMFNEIKNGLLLGEDIILDDLHLTLKQRTALLSSVKDIKCQKTLIVLQVPIEICIERDKNRTTHNLGENVIRHLSKKYEQPSISEGWDLIVFI